MGQVEGKAAAGPGGGGFPAVCAQLQTEAVTLSSWAASVFPLWAPSPLHPILPPFPCALGKVKAASSSCQGWSKEEMNAFIESIDGSAHFIPFPIPTIQHGGFLHSMDAHFHIPHIGAALSEPHTNPTHQSLAERAGNFLNIHGGKKTKTKKKPNCRIQR